MKRIALCSALLACVGCNEVVLYADMPEKEANEMMALLLDAGVSAAKEKGTEGRWTVNVAQGEFAKAVGELRKHGYPRDRYEDIGNLFKKSGLVSSPTEERIRLMYGLSQELSDTISKIDGVITAKVHIALPTANPFGEVKQAASASVFIKHRPSANLTTLLPQITKLVALLPAGDGPIPDEAMAIARRPVFLAVQALDFTVLGLLILDMVVKPFS